MKHRARLLSLIVLCGAGLIAARSALPTTRSPVAGPLPGMPLPGDVLYDGAAMSMPLQLAVAGDRLIVLDVLGRQTIHVLDRRTGALVESFGGRGDGPGEFRGARSIDVLPGGTAFWVHDVNLQRSTRYELDPDASHARDYEHREAEVLTFSDGRGVLEPIHVDDNRILTNGMFTKGRLGHLDAEGHLVRVSGDLPEVPEGLPPRGLQFVHQGALRGTPARDRFALSSLSFSRIELFDRQGTRRAMVEAPIELEPELVTRGSGDDAQVFVSPRSAAAYTDLAVTDAAIYALFSGRDPEVYQDDAIYGRQVHVFTWGGKFVGALDLDYDAIAIAVSPDGRELYGVSHFPAPEIRRHVLPAHLRAEGGGHEM